MMKRLQRALLLSVAMATTFFTGLALAGNVTVTPQIHSREGLTGVTVNQRSNDIRYEVRSAYAVGDKITFTFPYGSIVTNSFPSQINVAAVNSPTPDLAIAGMGLGLLNSDARSATYRVTSLSSPNNASIPLEYYYYKTTIGNVILLPGVLYRPSSLLSTNLTVTVDSQTSVGDVLDTIGTRTATVAEAKSQFGTVSITQQMDAVVDESISLNLFTPNAPDTFSWSIAAVDTTGWLNLATVNPTNGTTVKLLGGTGKLNGLTSSNFSSAGQISVNTSTDIVTAQYNGLVNQDTWTFTPPGNVPLQAQSFFGEVQVSYVSAAAVAGNSTLGTYIASGNWSAINHPTVTLSASANTMAETSGVATLTATLSNVSFENVTVNLGYSGSATSAVDYTTPASSIVIPAGQLQGSITLESLNDSTPEAGESISVDVTTISGGGATENGVQQQTVTILDDDVVNVSLSANNLTFSEASGSSTITATLTQATYQTVTVNLAFTGSATRNSDYTSTSTLIYIAAGQTTGTVTLTPRQDTLVEGDESIVIDISSVSGGNAIENGTQQQTLTITDDDLAPVFVSLSVSPQNVTENYDISTITATLDKATSEDVSVNLGFTGTAENGNDYTVQANVIVIAAGQTQGITTLRTKHDTTVEADETIVIDINSVSGANASESGQQRQTVTIANDDYDTILVTLSVSQNAISEALGVGSIIATLDKAATENVFVNLSYSGTATRGTDYSPQSDAIFIPVGQTSGSTTITATQDKDIEAIETIVIDILNISGASVTEKDVQQQTISLMDDDFEPVLVALSINESNPAEADGASIITATLDKATAADVSVILNYTGTATLDADYNAAKTILIAAGKTTGSTTLTTLQDTKVEGSETVIIDIVNVTGANASENGVQQQTLTIIDDDHAPVQVSLNVSPDILTEAGGFSTITAYLDSATFEDVRVNLALTGSASKNADYLIGSETLTISAGQISATTSVTPVQDSDVELLETLIIDIDTVTGGNAFESGMQRTTVTLLDDDISLISLNVDNQNIWEIGGASVISAVLDKPTYEDVIVRLNYTGTADAGVDYIAPSQFITIGAGQTTGTVTLTANQDSTVESPETIIADVALVSGGSAYEGGNQQVSIALNDGEIDTDLDGVPDRLDSDDDNDGIPDSEDAFPLDPLEIADNDGDGIGDNADTDDDNDGIPDTSDDFPTDPNRSRFTMIAQLRLTDASFATCINESANDNQWLEIAEVTILDCSNQSISNLAGIERFSGLTTLTLNDNTLTDVSLLANLSQLTELDLSHNNLADISALENLSALTKLDLTGNRITDISALSPLNQLTHLSLGHNVITDINPLDTMTALNQIELNNNLVTEVTGLFSLTGLANINLLDNNNIACRELDDLVAALANTQITRPTHCNGSGNLIANVTFANDNLRQCVNAAATKNNWQTVDEVTQLSCTTEFIDDLSGLDHFIHLNTLTLNDNQISDLAPLNSLIELTYLDLRKNAISDISGLNRLIALTTLKLAKNALKDIAVITNFDQLQSLSVADNQITDSQLVALAGLEHLTTLYLRDNQLTDITALTSLSNLTGLYLSRNGISDIAALAELDQLTKLELDDNKINDISALFDLRQATQIKLVGNDAIPCADIEALSATLSQATIVKPASCISISQIKFSDTALASCVVEAALQNSWITASQVNRLSCVEQAVKSVEGIESLTALEFLDLRRNQIVNIKPLRHLNRLTTLKLSKNQVAEISSLAQLTSLTFLSISENNFDQATLNALMQLSHLETLYLRNNQLTDITALGQMTSLTKLYLSNNSIADISQLAFLTELQTLALEHNQVTDISPLFMLNKANNINLLGNDNILCNDLDLLANAVEGRVLVRPTYCSN